MFTHLLLDTIRRVCELSPCLMADHMSHTLCKRAAVLALTTTLFSLPV